MKDNKNTSCSNISRSSRPGRVWRMPAALAGFALPLAALPLAALAAPAGQASSPKADTPVSRMLVGKAQTGTVSVIFKTTAPLTSAQESQMTALGAVIVRRLPIIQSVTVRLPERNLARLAALPFAAHLSLDGKVEKSDEFTVGSSEANLAFAASSNSSQDGDDNNGNTAYQLTGKGVTIAVVDSGIAPVADLKGASPLPLLNMGGNRLLPGTDFVGKPAPPPPPAPGTPAPPPLNPADPCGHGTHVAGIIAGNGTKSSTSNSFRHFFGIAPQANLVSVRVLDQNGCSTVSTVLAGLQWVMLHKNDNQAAPIRVVNLSLGHPVGESYTTDPICQAVEALYKSGVVVVCAAGNEGRVNGTLNTPGLDNEGWGTNYGSIQSPGNDPYVITVGATKNMDGNRADDKIATYSSRGPSRLDLVMKPDIIAAGNKVISLDAGSSALNNYAGGSNDIPQSLYQYVDKTTAVSKDYFQLSGTSMASPVVAGAAALLLQANPNLSPDTIKARLMLSADKWFAPDGTADPLTYGAGYLNIPAALASTVVAQGPAASPALIANSDGSVSVDLSRAQWSTAGIDPSRAQWSTSLWGTGVVDLRALWGSRAQWSTTSIDLSRAQWSTNVTFIASRAQWSTTAGLAASRAQWSTSTIGASQALWGSSVWGDRAQWSTSTTAVDLNSAAITGE